jgi:type VI secretion system secreted protein VgrG
MSSFAQNIPLMLPIVKQLFGVADLSDHSRPIRLVLPDSEAQLQQGMLIQHVSGTESLCGGLDLNVICLATSALIPTKSLMAMPIGIQMVNDRGELYQINGLVTEASAGQSDGSLSVYKLRVQDAFALLKHRRNSRVFMDKSITQITDIFYDEWKKNSPIFAASLTLDISGLKQDYPALPFTFQHDEQDADFLSRHWRKHGISWYVRPTDSGLGNTLCLFDDAMSLAQNNAGTVRYHRADATETRDSITSWIGARSLASGSTSIQQWQPQSGQMDGNSQSVKQSNQQGRLGGLSSSLEDKQIFTSSTNLSDNSLDRLGLLQIQRHELASKCFYGESTVRDLRVGEWITISEHPELDQHPNDNDRQFIITELHYNAVNNLPKGTQNQVEKLIQQSQQLGKSSQIFADKNENNSYQNHFTAIRRGIPLIPAYDHRVDVPHASPQIASVVTPNGEEVHCDDWGRVKVMFNGMRGLDHEHAGGAGSSNTDNDSAWVEVITPFAGDGFGAISLPRGGETVVVEFLNGDPDRPLIMGRTFNGVRKPPQFTNTGTLPNNRYQSGIKSQEIKGSRYNQLKFDDTNGQISSQLASQHGDSQLNLGFLTHPRDWTAEKRGEGFELRTDEHGAIRAAKGLYIGTDAQPSAGGQHLDIEAAINGLEQAQTQAKVLQKSALASNANPTTGTYTRSPSLDQQLSDNLKNLAQPNILISTPAGIAVTTPKSHSYVAGESMTFVAQKQIDFNSLGQWTANATNGLSLYSQQGGLKAYANQGSVEIQAQNDAMQLAALKDMTITSSNGNITISAKNKITIGNGSGGIEIMPDGTINIITTGIVNLHAQMFNRLAQAGSSVKLPNFSSTAGVHSHQHKATNPYTHKPTVNVPYLIEVEGQDSIYGLTDSEGLTQRVYTDDRQKIIVHWGIEALIRQQKNTSLEEK